jgi:hypothetical protein
MDLHVAGWHMAIYLSIYVCCRMIIGRTQKMLSRDWLQNFQYNQTQPQSREFSVHKESLQIASQKLWDMGLGLELT